MMIILAQKADTPNRIFAIVLSVLVLTLIGLILAALQQKAKEKKGPASSAGRGAPADPLLMGALARPGAAQAGEAQTAPAPERERDQDTIDKRYAEHFGRWVCRYCETINQDGLNVCQACGRPRS